MQINEPPQKQLLDVETFLEVYSLSRNKFYAEVKRKTLRITKLGNRTYVARVDGEAWLNKIREESLNATHH